MSRGDLKAIEAEILILVKENAPALVELQTLKRKRRALSAGYASGDKRRASVIERDEKIRHAYQETTERYGLIVALAEQHKLSVRQVHRIIGKDFIRQIGWGARIAVLPTASFVCLSEAPVTKRQGVEASPRRSLKAPIALALPSPKGRRSKTKRIDDPEGRQGALAFPPIMSVRPAKP